MILLIGSRGFLGRRILHILKKSNQEVVEMNSESGGILDMKNFPHDLPITHVIHAGSMSFVPDSWSKPQLFFQSIVTGTQNVLQYCAQHNVSLVYVSAYIYGRQDQQPIVETTYPVQSNPYAHAKLIAEKSCEFYRDFCDLKVNIIRPFNIYGPDQSEKFFISHLVKEAFEKKFVSLENTNTRRDFIYVDDVARAIVAARHYVGRGRTYNVGSGVSTAIASVIEHVAQLVGSEIRIEDRQVRRENEIMDCVADISLIKADFQWQPQVDLREGLNQIIQSLQRSKNE